MSRAEKAIAAFGSVVAVTLLYVWQWSLPVAFLVFVLGTAATVAVLRLTHPHARRHFK